MSIFSVYKDYNNLKDIEFVLVNEATNEDSSYVPRFSIKDLELFKDIPTNKPVKFREDLLIKAIKYGMIFAIQYKGAKDKDRKGNERVIYPMVYGRSSKGAPLLRGFHLNGWSVSAAKHINKIWRMFRTDRIISMTFTGSFYRLPPAGYQMNDKGMRGGIIAKADFSVIRKNQQSLLNKQVIQNKEDVSLSNKNTKFVSIQVKPTDTIFDLNNPMENELVKNVKDLKNLRLTFLKSLYGNKYIAIIDALGQKDNTVKVIANGQNLGVYKVLDSIDGSMLSKIKNVKGNTQYTLYSFIKKI